MGRLRQQTIDRIIQLHKDEWTQQEIAEEVDVDPATVRKYVKEAEEREETETDEERQEKKTQKPTEELKVMQKEMRQMKRKQTRLQNAVGSLWAESLRPLPCPHCKNRAGISYQHGWRCRNCGRDVFEVAK